MYTNLVLATGGNPYQFVNAGIKRRILTKYEENNQQHVDLIRGPLWSIV